MRRLLLCLLLTARAALAETSVDEAGKLAVSPAILKEFKAIETLAAKGQYAEAASQGEALLRQLQDDPPARALLLRNLALLYGQQHHYLHAAGLLQQSLDLHSLPAEDSAKAQLELAQFYAAAGEYAKAATLLSAWLAQAKTPQPEQLLMLADLRAQLKQYAEAAALMEQLVERSPAPKPEWIQRAAQYFAAAEDYPKAAAVLSAALARTPNPPPPLLLLLAEIETRLKHYAAAARVLEKLIAETPEPKPEWRQMLLGLQHENHDLPACIRVLEDLIQRDPDNPLYWQQLSGIYVEARQEAKALAIRQLMYAKGLLHTSEEILQLVQGLRYQGLPTRAAEILQRAMERGSVDKSPANLGLLADAWTEARELGKAASALEQSAALANTGETLHRLGQIYSEQHQWAKAREALTRALARGGLKNPGGAYLLLGMAAYRLNAKEQARSAFIQASQSPPIQKTAQLWLEHLDRESRSPKSR